MDVVAEGETQIFDRLGIERIDQGDVNGVVRARRSAERDANGPARPESGAGFGRRNFDLVEVDHFGAERVGDGLVKLRFVDNPVIDHCLFDGFAVLRRLEQDVIGLGAIHQALVDEEIGDAFVIHEGNDEIRRTKLE